MSYTCCFLHSYSLYLFHTSFLLLFPLLYFFPALLLIPTILQYILSDHLFIPSIPTFPVICDPCYTSSHHPSPVPHYTRQQNSAHFCPSTHPCTTTVVPFLHMHAPCYFCLTYSYSLVCLPCVTFLPAIPVCLPYTVTSLPFIPVFFVVVFLYAIAVFSVIPLFRCSFPPPISVLPAVPLLLAI